MTTSTAPQIALHGLARRLARRQQGVARAPLRGVGRERSDARVRRRRGRHGAGRDGPRAVDLPRPEGARRRGGRRGPRGPRQPPRHPRRRAARLDGVHRREPAHRRRADDLRRGVRRQLGRRQMAQRAKKILQEEGSHKVHAEAWARRLCRAGGGQRRVFLEHVLQTWEHAARWGGPGRRPGVRGRRCTKGSSPRTPRSSASRSAPGSSSCSPERASTSRCRSPRTGRAGTQSGAAGRHEPDAGLPVLRRGGGRARRPVGRADHHRAVALRGVRLVLRGAARGVRRPAGRRGRHPAAHRVDRHRRRPASTTGRPPSVSPRRPRPRCTRSSGSPT